MSKSFEGPDPSEFLPGEQGLVPTHELAVPGNELSPKARAVVLALLDPTREYLCRKAVDGLFVTDDNDERMINPDVIEQSFERTKLLSSLLKHVILDFKSTGCSHVFGSLDTVKEAAIGAYIHDGNPYNFFNFTADDPSESELIIRADEIQERADEAASLAAKEVEAFIGYLSIHFEEPEAGVDY